MALSSLGYIGIHSSYTDEWAKFANTILGMQQVDTSRAMQSFRMDSHQQRLVVTKDKHEGLAFMGWEVASRSALETIADTLSNAGIEVTLEGTALADQRQVAQLISFNDPEGNRNEVFYQPTISSESFDPGRPISGFKTGPLGMGHVVLHVKDIEKLLPFYRDLLGFKVSDYGTKPYGLYFFHLNSRHHTFAMVGSGQQGLHHFMIELGMLDDVGQGYDLVKQQDLVAYTLGRHTNDKITSFYAYSPSGFFVEYGWGGLVIDPDTWQAHETFVGPSYWGHDRLYLDEDSATRKHLKAMALDTAKKGLRAPNPQDCMGIFDVGSRQ